MREHEVSVRPTIARTVSDVVPDELSGYAVGGGATTNRCQREVSADDGDLR